MASGIGSRPARNNKRAGVTQNECVGGGEALLRLCRVIGPLGGVLHTSEWRLTMLRYQLRRR